VGRAVAGFRQAELHTGIEAKHTPHFTDAGGLIGKGSVFDRRAFC
jgi:hypothetical protein